MSESGFAGELHMDLSLPSAPVYGGGIIEIGLFGDLEIPEYARLFLVFDGSKQRQVTEAKVLNDRRLQAVIPDHEPPEIVALSLIVKLPSNGPCRTIAQDTFTYFLDQTCYLARYLADSVHNLEALEDWDYIRGPQFSLADENFPTLDERLTSAFQHLILPATWNLLGDPSTVHIQRETLFHFAARLGLSSLVALLLEKSGAQDCLLIRNKHKELAQDIARSKSYDGLADLISDPHAHGVIRWESTHHMTPTTTIKKHSFGTVTMSSEMHKGDFPPIEKEIATICDNHPPPPPDKPTLNKNQLYNGITRDDFENTEDLEMTTTTNATWGSEDLSQTLPTDTMNYEVDDIPPPIPPKPVDLYADYEDEEFLPENGEASEYRTENESSSYFSPTSIEYPIDENETNFPSIEDEMEELPEGILDDNLRHLHKISSDIHYIRQKDIARLKQSSPSDSVRLSNSCPNLGQEASFVSTDAEYFEGYDSPAAARSRRGLAIQSYDTELQKQESSYGSESDLLAKPNSRSTLYFPDPSASHVPHTVDEDLELDEPDSDSEEDSEEDGRADSPSRRPHSWHSVEKINEMKPNNAPAAVVISHKRSQSYQGNETAKLVAQQQVELTAEEKAEQADTITSPAVRRVRRHNNNAFAVVGQDNRQLKARSVNASVNNNNNVLEPDRRFTISEGTLSDPANFVTEGDSSLRQKSASQALPPKPQVLPRPEGAAPKSTVTRKWSFLTKMRNSSRAKAGWSKDRAKKPSDLASSTLHKVPSGEDNLTDSKDKESPRDFSWHAVKSKNKKGPSAANPPRPQSMMINKLPSTYGSSLPATPYFTPDGHVHGLPPVRPAFSKPTTAYEQGKLDPSLQDRYSKTSFKDEGDSSSLHSGSRTPPHLSQYNNVSGSIESLDEAVDLTELENDPDLMIKDDEPEAWSVTVEKKLLNKMHKKDIKRQDNIFEFIQKERNFLTTLKIMQKIFAHGMLRELQCDQESVVDKMFPQIDEFVEFTSNFVEHLDERQQAERVISRIGDILVSQWSGESGRQMMWLFGEFCSKQKEIVSMYKDMIKNDKKFPDFINKCSKNPLTRRRDIPGCILLVTQRITKYPVILKTLIDNSTRKEHKSDAANLNSALELVTDIIKKVDKQVLEYEKQRKVKEIYQKMESKSYATYKDGRKFTRDDFFLSIPKLLQVDTLQWKPNTVKRPIDVMVLLFKDVLIFLQENNQRYSFASVGQPAAVPLHKLIVREKAGEDSVLFLLSASSDKPEMYELVFQKASDSKSWMQWIRSAVDTCPEEDEGVSYQDVEEQRLMERKWVRAHQIITELEKKDKEVNDALQEKMKNFKMLAKVLERPEVTVNMKYSYPTYLLDSDNSRSKKVPEGAPTIQKAIEQVNKLSHAICGPGGLNRNPSSVGEHDSGNSHSSSKPKRSETFGGFDNGKEPPSPRTKFATIGPKYPQKQDSLDDTKRSMGQKETAHSEGDLIAAVGDSPTETDSGESSPAIKCEQQGMVLKPTPDQISALAELTHLLNEYLSIATQQDTQVQKMAAKVQLQSRRRNGDPFQEVEARRNQAKQTEMEQDLSKREERLKSEKEQWSKEYRRFQNSMTAEKQEFEEKLLKLKRNEIELERQQEEMKRVRDDYQKQLARLRELQRKAVSQDQAISHSSSYPTSLTANKNNSNSVSSALDIEDGVDENYSQSRNVYSGSELGSMPSHLSKSHSSLEGELGSGENSISKESSHSPTYTNVGDYPRTFPGTGKRDQSNLLPQQNQSIQAPMSAAGTAGAQKPFHLKFSATNQVTDPAFQTKSLHNVIPSNLTSKVKHGSQQVIPSKLKGLSGAPPSQSSSSKSTFTDGLKSKLPFSHHKKGPRPTNSSSELDSKLRSNTLSIPNNLKHSKSEANMDISNGRNRSTSSPSPITSLHPPESESGLERSNSASSNSSKEGTEKKKNKKRRSWGSNSEKSNEKEIYF